MLVAWVGSAEERTQDDLELAWTNAINKTQKHAYQVEAEVVGVLTLEKLRATARAFTKTLKPTDPRVLYTDYLFARAYLCQASSIQFKTVPIQKALAVSLEALANAEVHLPERDSLLIDLHLLVGQGYILARKPLDAVPHIELGLKRLRANFGQDSPMLARALLLEAWNLYALKKLEEAEASREKALAIWKAAALSGTPEVQAWVATHFDQLMMLGMDRDRAKACKALYKKTHVVDAKKTGQDQPQVAGAPELPEKDLLFQRRMLVHHQDWTVWRQLDGLLGVYMKDLPANSAQAETLCEELVWIFERNNLRDATHLGMALRRWALVASHLKHWSKALWLYERTVKELIVHLNKYDPTILEVAKEKRAVLVQAGREDELVGVAARIKSLEAQQAQLKQSIERSQVTYRQAEEAFKTKREKDAEELLNKILMEGKAFPGALHPWPKALLKLAELYEKQDRLPEAEAAWRGVLEVMKDAYRKPDRDKRLGDVHRTLAMLAQMQKSYDRMASEWETAIRYSRKQYGPSHPETAALMLEAVPAFRQAGHLEEAVALSEVALKVLRDHPSYVAQRNGGVLMLGSMYGQLDRPLDAQRWYARLLNALSGANEAERVYAALGHLGMADVQLQCGQLEKAEAQILKAFAYKKEDTADEPRIRLGCLERQMYIHFARSEPVKAEERLSHYMEALGSLDEKRRKPFKALLPLFKARIAHLKKDVKAALEAYAIFWNAHEAEGHILSPPLRPFLVDYKKLLRDAGRSKEAEALDKRFKVIQQVSQNAENN